jgi:excisionase family DNA binding protein
MQKQLLNETPNGLSKDNPDFNHFGLLKEKEAAAYLAISPRLLWGWRRQNKVPYIRFGSGAVRYKRQDLDRFIDSNRAN